MPVQIVQTWRKPLPWAYLLWGSTTTARGFDRFLWKRVLRWLPSAVTTEIVLRMLSVQYRLPWIQSKAIPSGASMSLLMTTWWWEEFSAESIGALDWKWKQVSNKRKTPKSVYFTQILVSVLFTYRFFCWKCLTSRCPWWPCSCREPPHFSDEELLLCIHFCPESSFWLHGGLWRKGRLLYLQNNIFLLIVSQLFKVIFKYVSCTF